ncbi:MAG: immunoglobulin domain-containing protein, partial [Lachnospiraceae bacterium]|nr:immunoglobulin domain-containing protein [Lachnospiraceae bacterium]
MNFNEKRMRRIVGILCVFTLVFTMFDLGMNEVDAKEEETYTYEEIAEMFSDHHVCDAIWDALLYGDQTEVKKSDFDRMEVLMIDGGEQELIDLTGLEHLSSLKNLTISHATLDSDWISKLKEINLESLTFTKVAGVNTLSGLGEYTKLTQLTLNNMPELSSLSGIEECENIEMISIGSSGFEDVSAIKNLKNLRVARLAHVKNIDMSIFEDLDQLTELNLFQVPGITDISSLKNKESLQELNIMGTGALSDTEKACETLRTLTNLKVLRVAGSDVNDLVMDAICDLTNLESLQIQNTSITDISKIVNLKSLKEVDIYENIFVDFSYFGELIKNGSLSKIAADEQVMIVKSNDYQFKNCVVGTDGNPVVPAESGLFTYNSEDNTITINSENRDNVAVDNESAYHGEVNKYYKKIFGEDMAGKKYYGVKASYVVPVESESISNKKAVVYYLVEKNEIIITKQPEATECTEGDKVEFEVTATSEDSEFIYQWYKDGEAITGETSEKLVIESAKTGDAGKYTCEVKNGTSSATSNEAVLTVNKKINTITITKQPEATECTEGDKVEFEVTATSEDSE